MRKRKRKRRTYGCQRMGNGGDSEGRKEEGKKGNGVNGGGGGVNMKWR